MENSNIPGIPGLENYVILAELGQGGGGTAYKAFQRGLEQEVVIKKIHSWVKKEDRRREVDILKKLRHQYLPAVHNYVSTPSGDAYTVMDYIAGTSIGDMIKAQYTFSQNEIIKYGTQLCEAVAYLHKNKVIHGDIKPDNIMLRLSDDNICLIDFNISGVGKDGVAYTNGYSKGYGAPEQVWEFNDIVRRKRQRIADENARVAYEDSDKTELMMENNSSAGTTASKVEINSSQIPEIQELIPITTYSDVYSIAATLFHMYTGKRIDKVNDIEEYLDGSSGFERFLLKALCINPTDRFADGEEMFKALKNLHKSDKRYRRLKWINAILTIFLIISFCVGIAMVNSGLHKLINDKERQYDEIVESILSTESAEEMESVFGEAVALFSGKEDAYTNKAIWLYQNMQYKSDIQFIEKDILSNDLLEIEDYSTIFYLLGNCYFQEGDYSEALADLNSALKYDDSDVNTYIDKAITQARMGQVEDALKTITKAEKLEANAPGVSMANGEINMALGEYDKAISDFEKCLSASQNEYQKMRAYVELDSVYSQKEANVENITKRLDILNEAKVKLPPEYSSLVMEKLVNAYFDAYSVTLDPAYDVSAEEIMEELISMGIGNLNTYSNLAVVYQREEEFDKALETINEMEKKYPDNYVVYKRRAFLERDIQAMNTYDSTADFSEFEKDYLMANELYSKQKLNNNDTDMEMLMLDQIYQELVETGWITK